MMTTEEKLDLIRKDVEYIKKMMEDLFLSTKTKQDNNDALSRMMDNLKTVLSQDPNIKKRPDIQETINKLFEVRP